MRACARCGLSIGETATFCPVCGAVADSPAGAISEEPGAGSATLDLPGGTEATASISDAAPERQDAVARRLQEASRLMRDAVGIEKTDPARAAELYRTAILRYLEVAEDPLDRREVRRDLLRAFDRLSLVLRREGLPSEALEVIESAETLGLLDCQDSGIKGHREALTKRCESLRRALDVPASPVSPV